MTEEVKSVIEALKQAIQSLMKISEPKPNFEPGKLIGIGDQRVFFVESIKDGKVRVSAYSPVGRAQYKILSDCDSCIDNDENDDFHSEWIDAVNERDTEESYHDYAETSFNDKKDNDPCNDIWFYGQEISGIGGERLCSDEELREAVNEDMSNWWCDDEIASWEDADNSELPEHWDKIYCQEAVDWLERQRKEEE